MKKFKVALVANARVSCEVEVEAENLSDAQAKALVIASEGNVVWEYDGVEDGTIELGA